MHINEFITRYGEDPIPIEATIAKWRERDLDSIMHTLAAAGLLTVDGLIGDGISDRVSPELLAGFSNLMGDKANSYAAVREILREKLEAGDAAVLGMVNKIKGQIGENLFIEAANGNARLAPLGNQEGWDVAVDQGDTTQYVQVKMYQDPDAVLARMHEVQAKADLGLLRDGEEVVTHVDFAIPVNVSEAVATRAAADPELAHIEIIPVDTTADEVAGIVREGFDNVGPGALAHLFGQLLGATISGAALHAMINAYRIHQNTLTLDKAITDTFGQTTLTSMGVAAGLVTETLFDGVLNVALAPTAIGVALATRIVMARFAKSRFDLAARLRELNQLLDQHIARLSAMGQETGTFYFFGST